MNSEAVNDLRAAIAAALAAGHTPTRIARDLGCSRGTISKVSADLAAGRPSIDKRTSRHGHLSWTDQVHAVVMDARRRHPSWGPRLLYAHLAGDPTCPVPRDTLPSPATIGRWIQDAGLARQPVGPRDTRHLPEPRPTGPGTVTFDAWGPWSMHGVRLALCTAQDRFSRLTVAIPASGEPFSGGLRGLTSQHWGHALMTLIETALAPGDFPLRALYLDNGVGVAPVFGALPLAPRLALARGAKVIYIPPAQPWRNGRLERFHWTLETEYVHEAHPDSPEEAIGGLVEWLNYYNAHRPHSRLGYRALGEIVPYEPLAAEHLTPVERHIPRTSGVVECIRLVMNDGAVEPWGGDALSVSPALAGQYVWVRFTVPGPAPGAVVYSVKGGEEAVVASFTHTLDAAARATTDPLVRDVRLENFAGDPPPHQELDEERDASVVARMQRRPSRRKRGRSGRSGDADV